MTYLYRSSVLGGTFDHFHVGHEKLLLAAFAKSSHVSIGIVQNNLLSEKSFPASVETYEKRLISLQSFLHSHHFESRSTCVPINDIYGTTLTEGNLEAIFVTKETETNAKIINRERNKLNLPALTIELVPYLLADDQVIISSRRIREGIIDRRGNSYLKLLEKNDIYLLPKALRPKLQTPIGSVAKEISGLQKLISPSGQIIAVGDIVSRDLLESGYKPSVCIIDHRTRRSDINDYNFPPSSYQLENTAGIINSQFGSIFLSALSSSHKTSSQIITINGEEDLLALPAILLSPLGSCVIYGQYGLGAVVVKVTESAKHIVEDLLKEFN